MGARRPAGRGRISRRRFLGLGAAGAAGLALGCGAEQRQAGRGEDPIARPYTGGYDERFRPRFHFSPGNGWINDPNGLVFFDGEYHLFFQHNPDGDTWGNISWGHAVSPDLVRWEELEVALEPDDLGLIWSGSAVVDGSDTSGFFDGQPGLVALYTNAGGKDYAEQVQSLAYSSDRGRTWTKYADNPVVPNPGEDDFRDPKVFWHAPTNKWILLLAAGDRILFYSSRDLKDWTELGEFGAGAGAHGGVWECPELFELPVDGDPADTRWVLQVDVNPGAPEGGSGAQYFVGDFDGEAFANANPPETTLWADYGKDFYATQDWSGVPDGRRLWIAWMNNWQYAEKIPTNPFRGAMSVPREVALTAASGEGVRLTQNPVAELEDLRTPVLTRRNLTVAPGQNPLGDLSGEQLELVADFEAGDAAEFGFRVRKGGNQETVVGYDVRAGRLFVDRTLSGASDFSGKFPGRHEAPLGLTAGRARMRILLDRSSVEVFGNDGQASITDLVFPSPDSTGVEVYATGGRATLASLEVFRLGTIWG